MIAPVYECTVHEYTVYECFNYSTPAGLMSLLFFAIQLYEGLVGGLGLFLAPFKGRAGKG